MSRAILTLLATTLGASACSTWTRPARSLPDATAPDLSAAVQVALGALPLDSLCVTRQRRPCRFVLLDSIVRISRLSIVESSSSELGRLDSHAVEKIAGEIGRTVVLDRFQARMAGSDTVNVSSAVYGAWTADSMHFIFSLAAPQDALGVNAHVRVRRTGASWRLVDRWLLDG